jgi:hypothetical protein
MKMPPEATYNQRLTAALDFLKKYTLKTLPDYTLSRTIRI